MVPAEDPKVEHIGTKQCVVDWLYIESMFFKSSGRSLDGVLRYLLNWFGNSKSYCSLDINPILQSNKSSSFTNIQNHLQWNFSEGCLSDNTIVNAKHGASNSICSANAFSKSIYLYIHAQGTYTRSVSFCVSNKCHDKNRHKTLKKPWKKT